MLKSVLIFFIGFACGAGVISISVNAKETKKIFEMDIFTDMSKSLEKQETSKEEIDYLKLKTFKNRELLEKITK